MKLVVQRVKSSKVEIHHDKTKQSRTMGKIDGGLMVLVGFTAGDTKEKAAVMAKKLVGLRLFPDDTQDWRTNVVENEYKILLVSQFTLFARLKGAKPDFRLALNPTEAQELYYSFVNQVRWEYELLSKKIPLHPETKYRSLIKPICSHGRIPFNYEAIDAIIEEHFENDAKIDKIEHRHSPDTAMSDIPGLELYDFNEHVQTTQFGAYMSVSLVNDGPVTLLLESNPDPAPTPAAQNPPPASTPTLTTQPQSTRDTAIEISIESTRPLPDDVLEKIDHKSEEPQD